LGPSVKPASLRVILVTISKRSGVDSRQASMLGSVGLHWTTRARLPGRTQYQLRPSVFAHLRVTTEEFRGTGNRLCRLPICEPIFQPWTRVGPTVALFSPPRPRPPGHAPSSLSDLADRGTRYDGAIDSPAGWA
jgi:hypothetical protein